MVTTPSSEIYEELYIGKSSKSCPQCGHALSLEEVDCSRCRCIRLPSIECFAVMKHGTTDIQVSWKVMRADKVFITGSLGYVCHSGKCIIPLTDTEYTLTAFGRGGIIWTSECVVPSSHSIPPPLTSPRGDSELTPSEAIVSDYRVSETPALNDVGSKYSSTGPRTNRPDPTISLGGFISHRPDVPSEETPASETVLSEHSRGRKLVIMNIILLFALIALLWSDGTVSSHYHRVLGYLSVFVVGKPDVDNSAGHGQGLAQARPSDPRGVEAGAETLVNSSPQESMTSRNVQIPPVDRDTAPSVEEVSREHSTTLPEKHLAHAKTGIRLTYGDRTIKPGDKIRIKEHTLIVIEVQSPESNLHDFVEVEFLKGLVPLIPIQVLKHTSVKNRLRLESQLDAPGLYAVRFFKHGVPFRTIAFEMTVG